MEEHRGEIPKELNHSSKNAVNMQKLDQIQETISETSSGSERCKSISVSDVLSRKRTRQQARAENNAAIERLEQKLDKVLALFEDARSEDNRRLSQLELVVSGEQSAATI